MKYSKGLFFFGILATIFFAANPAKAETYRAGELTVTLGQHEEYGRTYKGCDAKKKCISLNYGTAWRDNGYRGITWENGEYSYSISWREDSDKPMYLNVFKNSKRILRHKLVAVE
ncbi:MAG: hypothetical protein KME64_17835 [Scytonematopsis contorta HA4267-MV1]|jgi:hypothetical protein|nr:hypothetical protein [Scytonematopsis contorta HA4267-MV1]